MPLRAITSDRVCGSHPSDRSPRTAWQAGAEDAMHICTWPDVSAVARSTAIANAIDRDRVSWFFIRSSSHVSGSVDADHSHAPRDPSADALSVHHDGCREELLPAGSLAVDV